MKKQIVRLVAAVCCFVVVLPAIAASAQTVAEETQAGPNNYQLMDSNDPGGPVPSTGDVCAAADAVFPTDQGALDDEQETVALPFPFTFYGDTYNDITVGIQGSAAFGSNLGTDPVIGPFFMGDLEVDDPPGTGGNVYTCMQGSAGSLEFHIEWFRMECASCDGTAGESVSFNAVLYEADNSIVFNYWDTEFFAGYSGNNGGAAAIGIQAEFLAPVTNLIYSSGQDTILANPFAIRFFVPTCVAGAFGVAEAATLVTTRSGDLVKGTAGDDVIVGHFGDDTIFGAQGNDLICGGDGDDILKGRGGADLIDGGAGNDTIDGGGGLDSLDGNIGNDTIDGRGAADTIFGWDGDDILSGQEGADLIVGDNGDDTLSGQTGPDTLDGDNVIFDNNTTGNDTVRGGNGNDVLYGGPGTDLCAGNLGPGDQAEQAGCEQTPGVEILF